MQAHVGDQEVWHAPPFRLRKYRELVEHTARLSYANRGQLLFFRGQDQDYQSKARGSTLYPAIYRGDNLPVAELDFKLRTLDAASQELSGFCEGRGIEGWRDIKRKKYVQWSILQHYGVVPTPLIDVTHSLRVSCSFAQLLSKGEQCFVYVLGFPYPTNRISINSEDEIVNIRLLSICPPQALRPYFQEGYMAGTPDVTSNYDTKTELDFRNRLIAKFEIPSGKSFWDSGVEIMPRAALYPDNDLVGEICKEITLEKSLKHMATDEVGDFIFQWAELEGMVLARARQVTNRNITVSDAFKSLNRSRLISPGDLRELESLRRTRNLAAHSPSDASETDLKADLERLKSLSSRIRPLLRSWNQA